MTADETVLGGGRFATDTAGFKAMIDSVTRRPDRVWAGPLLAIQQFRARSVISLDPGRRRSAPLSIC
jgi:hypothetical protein